MSFNPDYAKPAHEVVFSRKRIETHNPLLMINNVPVKRVPFQKHLGVILDTKLDFNEHINPIQDGGGALPHWCKISRPYLVPVPNY